MSTSYIESGVELFTRINRKGDLDGINKRYFPTGGPFPNQAIEITGDPKKVNRNDLLIDFIVKCILPNKYNPEWKSAGAVLLNFEHQINILKIIKVIETHLRRNNVSDPKKEILKVCLKNLTIFNCYNPEELEIAFMNLERLILVKENINLIVIDNISAHYWISKHDNNNLSYYQYANQLFQKIFNSIKAFNILLLFARNNNNVINKKYQFLGLNYRIQIDEDEDQKNCFKTEIIDFDKQNTIFVYYRLNTILEFFNKD